jgi:hypothetical protein
MQLLEANKKRLLKQRNWIGVTPSKPVDVRFLTINEKSRIGKRRKIDGKSRAVACRRSPLVSAHQTDQDRFGAVHAFMSGALPIPTAADKVRVRIGSDVVTTAPSTQPHDYARSQTNSDPMLFDEQDEDVTQQVYAEPAIHLGNVLAAEPRLQDKRLATFGEGRSPQYDRSARQDLVADSRMHAESRIRQKSAGQRALIQYSEQSEATDPSYRITHRVGSIDRSLKLVFDSCSPSGPGNTASAMDKTGGAQNGQADFEAEELETGHAFQNVGGAQQLGVRRPPNPLAIVDDEPWKSFLDIRDSSSGQVNVKGGTGTSLPQPHISARNARADRTVWPQHATPGNLTQANLSNVSALSPAPKHSGGRPTGARPNLRTGAVRDIDDSEELWRSFVLGSHPQSDCDTIHSHDEMSEDSMSRATKGYAWTRMPLSNAVTSVTYVSSTPFRSLSGQASRISDDVQYAPHQGSWSITSQAPPYAVRGRIESLGDSGVQAEDWGDETSAISRFGERPTHVSLQNHASHDGDLFSDTRTSRSNLDQLDRAWDHVSRQAQAGGSVVWQRHRSSSIRDIPDSD